MASQNSIFRLLLLTLVLTATSSLSLVGACLANCATCEPNNLGICKGSQPCQWGHHDPSSSGSCTVLPTLTTLIHQLNSKSNHPTQGWTGAVTSSTCEYTYQGKKKAIDVLGIFGGVTEVTRVFTVTPGKEVYFLSFNLVRDEWLPFNDFLMVDISSGDDSLLSAQISYEERVKVESQATTLSCEGKRFMSQKYNIRITGKVYTQISVSFTSFLFSSNWALTNIKLLEGCDAFSGFDDKAQTCSKCDSDSYLVQSNKGDLLCKRCPSLCTTCNSNVQCTSCVSGAKLDGGNCSFSSESKVQQAEVPSNIICGSSSFSMGFLGKSVSIPSISNDKGHLYDEVQIGFTIYYNPTNWNTKTLEKIIAKINKVDILTINYQNLTNSATDHCKQFKGERIARINLLSKPMVQVSNTLNVEFQLVGKTNLTFGITDVFIKSLAKTQSSSNTHTQNKNHQQNNAISSSSSSSAKLSSPSTSGSATSTTSSFIQTQQIFEEVVVAEDESTEDKSTSDGLISPAQPAPQQASISMPQDLLFSANAHTDQSSTVSILPDKQQDLSYMPTLCKTAPGLQFIIPDISRIQGKLGVAIDKLSDGDYEIGSSFIDDSTLHLCITITNSFIDATVTIYDRPTPSTVRMLQTLSSSILAKGSVPRFDYITPSQLSSINSFSVFFSVFAWVGLIMIICAVMLGYGVTMEQFIFSLQFLFLHIYIASQSLPLSFREVVAGLRVVENLNFFVPSHARSIQDQWLGNVVQRGPDRLSLYNTDINFSREFYPILIINIIYGLWFCLVFLAKKWLVRFGEKSMVVGVTDNITKRIVNFADQIWRYQFLATLWFCLLQFHNLAYPADSNRSQTLNTLFCICCFLATLAWPALIGYYCRKQYYENEYQQFIYQFEDLFYLRIPRYYLPTPHHRVGYRVFSVIKTFLIVFLIACGGSSSLILLPLLSILMGQLIYIRNYAIFCDRNYFYLKAIENCLFAGLQILLMVVFSAQKTATSSAYMSIGWALSTVGVLIVINSSIRTAYLIMRKYSDLVGIAFEEADPDHNKLKTERVV